MSNHGAASDCPFVSVVLPVKNGAGRLETCLESLNRQTYPKDRFEIIVADGRSTDATAAIAKTFGCIVVDNPRQTVAGGRNAGVGASKGELIAFSEDDMVLPPTWLAEGVAALVNSSAIAVGGPTPIPYSSSPFSKAVDFIFKLATLSGYSVQSGLVRAKCDITDIPGGNSIYRREAFTQYGPVDEALVTGEDVDFHLRIRANGLQLAFSSSFLAYHHKRDSPPRFFNQIRRFAQGRVQLGRRHHAALRLLHWVCAIAFPIVVLAAFFWEFELLLISATLFALLSSAVGLVGKLPVRAAAWLPMAVGIFLSGWSFGFIKEFIMPTRDATGR